MVIRAATCFCRRKGKALPLVWRGTQTRVAAYGNSALNNKAVEGTVYPLATHKYKDCQTPGLPRTLLIWDGAPGVSTFVLIVRTLSHQPRMPHFLELLVKVALSVTFD
jgi:hypothetical protein